jgi:hypothetical protein
MNYKIKNSLKKSKPAIIVAIVLWLGVGILAIAPLSVSIVQATGTDGVFNINSFFEYIFGNTGDVSGNMSKVFSSEYIGTYIKNMIFFTIAISFFAVVSIIRMMPKNEYSDIEHGSSDWSEGGEQYSILSKSKGIILAEKHYLPIDKRGNVNVLVVGRVRFW